MSANEVFMQEPIFDYSELLDEARDRIEERLFLEGVLQNESVTVAFPGSVSGCSCNQCYAAIQNS